MSSSGIDPAWIHVLYDINIRVRLMAYQEAPYERIASVLDGLDYVLDRLKEGEPGYADARRYLLGMAEREPLLNRIPEMLASIA